MCLQTARQPSTDEFAGRLLEILNGGGLALMISIGHRTGLFDTMSTLPASSSREIALAAKLNERYVREWLGAMVTGKIVNYDENHQTYHLPREHSAVLTRSGEQGNMSSMMQWVALLGTVEDRIIDCFRNGGGLDYSEYKRFHPVMAEESMQTTVLALEDHIMPAVPGLCEKLGLGIDVLDIGCGSGFAMIQMAKSCPNSRFTGYDLCPDAVERGRKEAAQLGLKNVTFTIQDASTIIDAGRFDLITAFDAIHDQARPDVVLANIAHALKKDGVFLMQDIDTTSHVHQDLDNPLGPFVYTISCMHCMSVSLAQGGMGLGAAWGEAVALDMLKRVGFNNIEVIRLPHDILNAYFIARLN